MSLCTLILPHVPSSRRNDLLALLKSSKAFHAATEPVFYSYVVFTNVHRLQLFAHTILTVPRLAAYVKTFGTNLQELRASSPRDAVAIELVMRRDFWEGIRRTLQCMSSLDVLVLAQIQGIEMDLTWVLDAPFPFHLTQVKLHIPFDHHVATFLHHQPTLRTVQMYAYDPPPTSDPSTEPIPPISLPLLTQFDGSLSAARYILPSNNDATRHSLPPLTHLQLLIDTTPTPFPASLLPSLTLLSPTLRGLSLLDIPKDTSTPLLTLLANAHPLSDTLTHLSHLYLPFPAPGHSPERVQFLGALIKLRRLRSIEVTLNAWETAVGPTTTGRRRLAINQQQQQQKQQQDPIPTPAAQKALAAEMKTYCPTLRTIAFWIGKTRFRWMFVADGGDNNTTAATSLGDRHHHYHHQNHGPCGGSGSGSGSGRLENAAVDGEWQHRVDTNQWPALSNLWCTC